jgi:MATE family multidrug resistance protein
MSVEVKSSWMSSWMGSRVRERGDVSEVAALAFPVILQTIAETSMQLIDSAMVGRLGAAQLGAIGLAGIWLWTLFVPFTGTASGVQVFVARHHGANEPERCGPWVWQALCTLVPAMVLWMLAVGMLLPALLDWIARPGELHDAALAYTGPRLLGGPAVVANFVLMSFFRGLGDTRTPMRAALVGVSVNVVVAWALIFGKFGAPQLGVAGAGYAVSAGSWTICVILVRALLRPQMRARYHTAPRLPERESLLRFLRTSAPIGGQWVLDMTTFAVFTSIVARMGEASMAASQAMLQLLSLSFMQVLAIATAAGALVGRYIGAGDIDAAQRSYRSAQMLALGVSVLVAALFVAVPEKLLAIFGSDPGMLALARPLLALGALFQVIDAVGIIASGSLRGAGDTRWPLVVQALLAWLVRLPVVYVAAIVLHGGVFGAWAGELVYLVTLGTAFVLRFHRGAWRSLSV